MSDKDEPKESEPFRASPILWTPDSGNLPDTINDRIHESAVAKKAKRKDKNKPSLKLVDVSLAAENPVDKEIQPERTTVRYSAAMRDIPSTERPRERFIAHGAAALSTSELIAILLRTGTKQRSAVSLAEHILSDLGGLARLAEISVEELEAIDGIGRVKAIEIKAALELGKRISTLTPEVRPMISSPQDVSTLLQSELRYLKKETLKSVLLDAKNRVIAIKTVSIGDLTSSIVHPREVFRDAIVNSAAGIIIVHNHPSGDPTPSADDVNITRRLIAVGETIGIDLLDHIVIGDDKFVSLKEKGLV